MINQETLVTHRKTLESALMQIAQLNRLIAIDLRRHEANRLHLDIAHDLGLTLERALSRAHEATFDA